MSARSLPDPSLRLRDRDDAQETAPSPILAAIGEIHERWLHDFGGQVATYIPELAKADQRLFGLAVATTDGAIYEAGDSGHRFTIQSISKPIVYGVALEDWGADHVLAKVGVEPSGDSFNSVVFDERHHRPFNPMVNAGAIVTTSLVKGRDRAERLARLLDTLSRYAGRPLEIDDAVLASERATGHRNRAIAYLALNGGMIDDRLDEHLDLYFAQCSVLVTARDLAVMAATLANHGVNPVTGVRALEPRHVGAVLSVMHTCGMYDYSGEWAHRVGLPAKSGVAGGLLALLPGQLGIGSYSPLLDEQGNSRRGIQACEALSARFKLHIFKPAPDMQAVFRRRYRGGAVRSKRWRSRQEQSILQTRGDDICVYELQGALYFGTMERVLRQLAADLDSLGYLVLDMARVLQSDECVPALLAEMQAMLHARHKVLVLARVRSEVGAAVLSAVDARAVFPDCDAALEFCEDDILRQELPDDHRQTPVALGSMDALAGFDPEDLDRLEAIAEVAHYPVGAMIVREGDPADAIYFLAAGRASVSLGLADGFRRKRLTTLAPGVAFGEVALFGGGPRSADVIADEPTICYVVTLHRLDELTARHPQVRARLTANLVLEISGRLRRADAEIRALEG